MAVFNCSPSELKKIIISTQMSDLPTGELTVTDSLKIKGVQGVSISVDGDELLFGIDGNTFPDGIGGDSLPEITANDAGKVLTANADGTAGWKETAGGINISSAHIGQALVVAGVENGKPTHWRTVSFPENTNVITASSINELPMASTVPMNTIALVTSEG